MDALLEDQREARPAADRGAETRKPAGAGSRRSCPFRPHPSFRWIAPGYGVGLRGVSSTPLLMLMNVYYGARVMSIASGSRSATYELRRQASDGADCLPL